MKGGIALKRVMPSSPLRLFCFFLLKNAACFHTQSKTPGQRKSLVMPHLLVCACFLRVPAPVSKPLRQQSLRGHLEKKLLFFRCFYPLFLVVGIFHETIRRSTQMFPHLSFRSLDRTDFPACMAGKKIVRQMSDWGKISIILCAVHAVIDGNAPHFFFSKKYFFVISE